MRQSAALFGPVVEVRDVLESFLHSEVLLQGWRQTLTRASGRFVELGIGWSDTKIRTLGERIDVLADTGLDARRELTRSIAAEVDRLLDDLDVPGLPRPDDGDWRP